MFFYYIILLCGFVFLSFSCTYFSTNKICYLMFNVYILVFNILNVYLK